jgi:hypothetical protein
MLRNTRTLTESDAVRLLAATSALGLVLNLGAAKRVYWVGADLRDLPHALAIVAGHALRVARTNPIHALR